MIYNGEFDVGDNEFSLSAERFSVDENGVRFYFIGHDEYGRFNIEGNAKLTEHGYHMASKLPVKYGGYSSDDEASIKFISVDEKRKEKICEVTGAWIQGGDTFPFNGTLKSMD